MRQRGKHTGQDREGLANLAQKQHGRPRDRVGGQEAASLPMTLSVPLAGPRHPSGHFPTSPEGRKGREGPEQGVSSEQEAVISRDLLGEGG